jgi:hypothetical protein
VIESHHPRQTVPRPMKILTDAIAYNKQKTRSIYLHQAKRDWREEWESYQVRSDLQGKGKKGIPSFLPLILQCVRKVGLGGSEGRGFMKEGNGFMPLLRVGPYLFLYSSNSSLMLMMLLATAIMKKVAIICKM